MIAGIAIPPFTFLSRSEFLAANASNVFCILTPSVSAESLLLQSEFQPRGARRMGQGGPHVEVLPVTLGKVPRRRLFQ